MRPKTAVMLLTRAVPAVVELGVLEDRLDQVNMLLVVRIAAFQVRPAALRNGSVALVAMGKLRHLVPGAADVPRLAVTPSCRRRR